MPHKNTTSLAATSPACCPALPAVHAHAPLTLRRCRLAGCPASRPPLSRPSLTAPRTAATVLGLRKALSELDGMPSLSASTPGSPHRAQPCAASIGTSSCPYIPRRAPRKIHARQPPQGGQSRLSSAASVESSAPAAVPATHPKSSHTTAHQIIRAHAWQPAGWPAAPGAAP